MLYYSIGINDSLNVFEVKNSSLSFSKRGALSRNVKLADSIITIDLTNLGVIKALYIETDLQITVTLSGEAILVDKILFIQLAALDSLTISCSDSVNGANVKILLWGS